MDPLARRVAERYAHAVMPVEPVVHSKPPNLLHEFVNDEDGVVVYVYPSLKSGKFNMQLRSRDEDGERIVSNIHDYPSEERAIAEAKRYVGTPTGKSA
jgi:hypothetical protein